MLPCESSATLCVLPHLMCEGRSPQSPTHANVHSPLPRIGALIPALSCACKINGAARPVPMNALREMIFFIFHAPDLVITRRCRWACPASYLWGRWLRKLVGLRL